MDPEAGNKNPDAGNNTPEPKTVSVEEYDKLKGQMQHWQAKFTDMEKRFDGIDPDKAKADADEIKILRRDAAAGDQTKIDELIANAEKEAEGKYSKKLGEYEAENIQLKNALKNERVVKSSLSKAAAVFNDDALEFIETKIAASCDFEDGAIVVKDEAGKVRPSPADPRKNMSVEEFLSELSDKYPSFAKAVGSNGGRQGGTKGDTSAQGSDYERYKGMNNADRQKNFTPDQREKFSKMAIREARSH